MTVDLERIKESNRIEEVIGETHDLKESQTRYLKGREHDSLVVDTHAQYFHWNSKGWSGDVIEWLSLTRNMDFKQAVEWLADRVGISVHMDKREAAAAKAHRAKVDVLTTLVEFLKGTLANSPAATDYCEGRGWDAETVERSQLGFWDGNHKALAAFCRERKIDVSNEAVQIVMSMKVNMLIYTHWHGGRCVYISGRAIDPKVEKRYSHYNPTVKLMGERQVYWNHMVNRMVEHVVIVEGQADAITLGQWNIPAVALAGVAANQKFLKALDRFERIYLGLDGDEAGEKNVMELAAELGAKTRIVTWPKKDPNEWLIEGGDASAANDLLGAAPFFALWLCERAAAASPMERDAATDLAIGQVAKLPEYSYEKSKKEIARVLGVGVSELNGMRKALLKESDSVAHKIEMTLPNGFLDGHLFEMVYEPDHKDGPKASFAVRYPDGRISITNRLETENYRILPLSPLESILRRGFIKLAGGLGDYSDDVSLQQEIQAFIHKYVDLPEHIEVMASYYVMMTWLFDKFYVLPYLRARGDSDSGKSRFTETIGHLCLRGIMITGSTTPSPVFRLMEAWNGMTVIMDEADLPHSETSGDWIQMLNTGYKHGSGILRTNMGNGDVTIEAYSAFGPKVLNMRGKFADDATESRCLTWETSSGRGVRPDIPRYMDREAFEREACELRNKLLRWRLRNWADVDVDYNHERTKHLPGRLVEITVSLMSISNNEEFKGSVMSFVERMNERAILERQGTLPAKVLEGIFHAYYLPDQKILDMPDYTHEQMKMQVSHITRQTNRIMNQENLEASLNDGEDVGIMKELKPGTIGKILANDLNLETGRAKYGTKGKILLWDAKRMNALLLRYGMEELVMDLAAKANEREQKMDDDDDPSQSEIPI